MSLDLNALQQENERLQTDNMSSDFLKNFVKMPDGNGHVVVRFLYNKPSGQPFYVATRIHRVNNKSIHCPRELNGERWLGDCSICDYYNWLWRESEKKGVEEAAKLQASARAIKPIERYYYNCIVRSQHNKETDEIEKNVGPLILSIGKTLHKMIIRGICGDKKLDEPPLGDVTNVKTGRDLKIIKTMKHSGKESYPNYSDSKFLEPSPLGDPDQIQRWMADVQDIKSLRKLIAQDEMKLELKKHLGLVPNEAGTGFDPSEFQISTETRSSGVSVSSDDLEEGIDRMQHAKSKKSYEEGPSGPTLAQVASEKEEDEVLADEAFLSELQNM